jgi:hypothetical protein
LNHYPIPLQRKIAPNLCSCQVGLLTFGNEFGQGR